MSKINYIQQLDEEDCGAAVLAMIFKKYKSDISIATIRNIAQTDKDGTTALGLIKAAEHFGFETRAIKGDMRLFELPQKDIPLPFIAHVDKENGILHFICVFEVHKSYLLVADPDPTVRVTKMSYTEFEKIWTGVTIFMAPAPEYKPTKDNNDSLWSLAGLVLKQQRLVATIILSSIIITLISVVSAFFLQQLIDNYLPNGAINTLSIVSIGLVIAYIFHGVFSYVKNYLSLVLGQRLSIDILLSYIKHLFELPMSFFGTRKTGEITSRFEDASNIIDTLAATAISTLLNTGTILVVGVTLATISIKLFLIACLALPIYTVIVLSFVKLFDKLNNSRMESGAVLSSSIIEDLKGIESIKAMNVEKKRYRLIDHEFVDLLKKNYSYNITAIVQESLKDITQLLINVSILYFGAMLVIHNSISVGQLIAFNALLTYFTQPLVALIDLQNSIQTAKIANKRLNQIFMVPGESVTSRKTKNITFNKKTPVITMNNVSFEYKYNQEILHNIQISISQNSSTAIVGLSGSGKTTLAKLMVNFYSPTKGEINLGGSNLESIDISTIRSNINYLPQNPYIFSGSVAENIALGSPDEFNIKKIQWAAKMAEIDADIQNLSDGYDTKLSEDYGLSGGQKQRIAIARALLSEAPIMIFDESTSNLDLLTEKKVTENILAIPNKTLIFIAHRLNIARKVDQIIVMNHGQIIETGTHDELLSNTNGTYYSLLKG